MNNVQGQELLIEEKETGKTRENWFSLSEQSKNDSRISGERWSK